MMVLVSFCNVGVRGAPLLGLLDSDSLTLDVLRLPRSLERCHGITGLAVSDEYVFAVAQSMSDPRAPSKVPGLSSLLILDRSDLTIRGQYAFERGLDVHSVWIEQGRLWVVSTGTDEVLELALDGPEVKSETVVWRPEPGGPRSDLHHLNAICRFDGRLVVAGFGKKAGERWSSATEGFVCDVENGQKVASGLEQPHSLAEWQDALVCCESRKMSLSLADGSRSSQRLSGYTRGLCSSGGRLLVGTSRGRLVSKSANVVNNPSDPGVSAGSCSIYALVGETLEVEAVADIDSFGREIYDLVPVDGVSGWPVLSGHDWREQTLRSLWSSFDDRVAAARRSEQELATERAAHERTGRDLDRVDRLSEALQRIESTQRLEASQRIAATQGTFRQRMGTAARVAALLARPTPGRLRVVRAYLALRGSELFDRRFYLAENPDVARSGLDPVMHYVEYGWREGRDPSPHFNTLAYLDSRPHLVKAGLNPLFHHLRSRG